MLIRIYDPNYWKARAEKVTERLREARKLETRELLMRLRRDYLMIARLAEERAKQRILAQKNLN